MKDRKLTEKEMEEERIKNNISETGTMLSSLISSKMDNVSCINDNKNHAVGSTITTEDSIEYKCTDDGTWQVVEKSKKL